MTKHPERNLWRMYLRAVVVKPVWKFLTTGAFFTCLSVLTWWRDNFASEEWKRRLDLKGLLPHWHPAWWVCVGLCILILLLLRESHAIWLGTKQRLDGFENVSLPDSAPEVSITSDREMDLGIPESLLIRNVGRNNIYEIEFQAHSEGSIVVVWESSSTALLEPSRWLNVSPKTTNTKDVTSAEWNYNFSAFIDAVSKTVSKDEPIVPLGRISFTCLDKRNNRYDISAPLSFVRPALNVRIGSITRHLVPKDRVETA